MLADVCGVPVLGVIPYFKDIFHFAGAECKGYEIHQGVSDTDQQVVTADHCIGTYIHGFLDNAPVVDYLLKGRTKRNDGESKSYADFKEEQYDKLAAHVRQHVDMQRLYQILTPNQ